MKGYKVFNPDMSCLGFQYEVGKEYIHKGKVIPCESGFHFCEKAVDCFKYYAFDSENIVCEVEGLGILIEHEDKIVCSEIKIIRELSWIEVLEIVNVGKNNTGHNNSGNRNSGNDNSGYRNSGNRNSGDDNSGNDNSGYRNSGNRNSGYDNSGYRNSGNYNSGNDNSGYWNSCNKETGHFNSVSSGKIRVFNRECLIEVWGNAEKPGFIYSLTLHETKDKELIKYSYKEAWLNAWNEAKSKNNWKEEYDILINLPNFNKDVFFEITGIDVEKDK